MPRRTDIKKILIIGSGPIIISQACEFDYSGTQACKALRADGFEIVLINSNPATIMTDPEMADRTYIEPITPEVVARIIERERPQALLPTLGGQTGLNTSVAVAEMGVLERFGVEMIGARTEVIKKAEDRELFRDAMKRIGLNVPESGIARSLDEALAIASDIPYPIIVRPAFTLGGTGGGVAYNKVELEHLCRQGLTLSMIGQVMLERSLLGWKEFELEVMRDLADNVVIVCSIENFDPMGVHTGDSITVAPAQTLTDREYQAMRDASLAIMREIGVETGGSNIQFAVNPADGEMMVIEMNPRVSRSSALASKATGFPIAKIAAKLAVGYTLDEIPNDITRETMASFEPTIDYCVVKVPRWTFEKFPGAEDLLTTSMKSVGETMAIGRTFKEALQKGLRSLEVSRFGLGADGREEPGPHDLEGLKRALIVPNSQRIFQLAQALRSGVEVEELARLTHLDPWFLDNLKEIIERERELAAAGPLAAWGAETMRRAKRGGFSDVQIGHLTGSSEDAARERRHELGVEHTYKLVDTCAAEFEAFTPYYYSTYEDECEARVSARRKVMILGGGPNRIGQGIEFDYCCVHAAFAIREEGAESIMVNSNPETVSTDYDTADKLYFEPLTKEDVLNIVERERPEGVIVQFGGQTPLNLAVPLARAGVPILGTSPDSIDRAEDRDRFKELLARLGLRQPPNGTAFAEREALEVARRIGYPVVVRPSYVLGGRAMKIVYEEPELAAFIDTAARVSPEHRVLIDKFLEDAVEVDVDAVADATGRCVIGGIMEHIEEAGVHSGDSACVLPPHSLAPAIIDEIKVSTKALAAELGVVGLMNIQYAVKDNLVYVLEVNPRASRTVPFVSKATGVPLAKVATKVMLGRSLEELGFTEEIEPAHVSVKEAVFPFVRFPGVDILLGPEMKSTGEVMGVGPSFGISYAKSQLAAGQMLPLSGTIFISVRDHDKPLVLAAAKKFAELGFHILATSGTSRYLAGHGVPNDLVYKVSEQRRPNIIDRIKSGQIGLVINTALGADTSEDALHIRRTTLTCNVPYATTVAAARAMATGIEALRAGELYLKSLQEYHPTPRLAARPRLAEAL